MKKMILLLDEWKNDRNFVGSELEVIKKYFDVTLVCNDFNEKEKFPFPEGVKTYFYNRKNGVATATALIKCVFDKEFYREIGYLKKDGFNLKRLSEVVRFYINAELFYDFLQTNNIIFCDDNVIYYSYWNFWKCFAVTKHKKSLAKSRIISRIHGYDLYKYRVPTNYQPFKRAMDSNLDKLFFISEYGKEYYHTTYSIKENNKHELRKLGTSNSYGIGFYKKENEIHIVTCSRMIELKRIDLLIKALSMIDDIRVDWKHFGDGPLLNDMKDMANKLLGNMNNISYTFMGHTQNSEIMKYYFENSIDAFILTSSTEGNPVSVIEAMSFGIPIISTNICNMSNLVKDNGYLISENPKEEELANAIINFSNMAEEDIMKMRDASRNIWEEAFVAEKNNNVFVMELNKL